MTKTAIFTLGLPGSGKSTFIKSLNINDYFVVSADDIRLKHPLYNPKYPNLLHEECVQLAEDKVYSLAGKGLDIIMDGGGINDHYTERIINHLKTLNYQIHVYFINTPVNICIQRNKERINNEERFVPISAIIEKSYKLQDSVNRLKKLADEFIEIPYFTNQNIFIDMDGVVAEYQELPTDEDGNINFVSHDIFINAKPVKEVINKLEQLYKQETSIFILSASPNSISSQQKREWLKKHMSFLGEQEPYFVGNKDFKYLMLKDLISHLGLERKDCTLIDDDHFILDQVNKLGIRAIHPSKFLANF